MAAHAHPAGAGPGAAVSVNGKLQNAASIPDHRQQAQLSPADTRVDPSYTRLFGREELHVITFQPRDDRGGCCDAIGIQLPEASRALVKQGLARARELGARVAFLCDTHQQAVEAYCLALRKLPRHRFVSQERAAAGMFGPLQ
jgi:hypothetical protein